MSGIGHNSGDDTFDVSAEQLAKSESDAQLIAYFERIERLEDEKKGISDDVKDTFSEAKSQGYDTKTMRQILRLRKMRPEERQEMEMLIETYKIAINMN